VSESAYIELNDSSEDRLSQLADEVNRTGGRVVLTRNGQPLLVMMSPEELESWEETLALYADPEAQARIAQGEAEIAAGDYVTAAELRAEHGLPSR
jgi:prevent-host-death family protein